MHFGTAGYASRSARAKRPSGSGPEELDHRIQLSQKLKSGVQNSQRCFGLKDFFLLSSPIEAFFGLNEGRVLSEKVVANGSLVLEDLNCSDEELTGRTSKNF